MTNVTITTLNETDTTDDPIEIRVYWDESGSTPGWAARVTYEREPLRQTSGAAEDMGAWQADDDRDPADILVEVARAEGLALTTDQAATYTDEGGGAIWTAVGTE